MRRLPVYLLIDCSGSMMGEPIEAVKVGLQTMTSALRTDPYALETVHLSVITFSQQATQTVPLTELVQFQVPDIQAGGTTDPAGKSAAQRRYPDFSSFAPQGTGTGRSARH